MREKHFYLRERGNRKFLVVSYKSIESDGYVELTQAQRDFLEANPAATAEEIEKCEMSASVDQTIRTMMRMINRHAIAHPIESEAHLPDWKSRRMNGRIGRGFQQ